MSNTFGPEYDARLDGSRIRSQFDRIVTYMLYDSEWRTLAEISANLGYPESSVSAQLRHARKERFGSYRVTKRRRTGIGSGTWEYRMRPPLPQGQLFVTSRNGLGRADR